ncbi:RNA-directed DNA polymerase, eukaryota [Tanacetum coccineum]
MSIVTQWEIRGGYLVGWDPLCVSICNIRKSNSFVMIRGVWKASGVKLMLVSVYAPHVSKEKHLLWDYLESEIKRWEGEVIIMGDFNEVRYKCERFGSVFNAFDANVFNSFIVDSGLVEVVLGGNKFTWCHKSGSKMSKLDRFLVSENLMNAYPNINAITMPRFLSDHCPIFLREISHDYGPIPFKVFHHWFDIAEFNNLVEDIWNKYSSKESNPIRYFSHKLKFLKGKIREWNLSRRSADISLFNKLKIDLDTIDEVIDRGDGNDSVTSKRVDILNDLNDLNNIRMMEVAQKSKIRWAIEGDENSSFFHGMLNKKRRTLNVRGILVEGNWIEKPSDVKEEFFKHFSTRFQTPGDKEAIIDMDFPIVLSEKDRLHIEREVSNDEVKNAVWECGMDKSPGPDGFTFGFYRKYWDLIKGDVINAVRFFFTHNDIPLGCNSSFITLIPKNINAKLVKEFRPISLIGSFYKIVAKILAIRLASVIKDLVNEVQSAFIADRQILDGPFLLNEVIQWCNSKKKQMLIFKVDFEKAYDSVRWDYLDEILRKFGFGDKWCKWIQCCLKSSKGSILVNGSPTKEFDFGRGLKQGDPLSSFLFLLVMESLHLSFSQVVKAGMFQGMSIGDGSVILSHLFYADDAVFVGQWNASNINTLVHVLDCFHQVSGLRINMCKSKIMGLNVDGESVNSAARKLGCLVLDIPFIYLGSIVGDNMTRQQAWQEIVDRVKSKLSIWKMKMLSIGGRLTLVKSVLGSLPIYNFSLFKVPMCVLNELEGIRRKFFNGHEQDSRRSTWVKWNKVLMSKDRGGLGVSSLYAINRGLLIKWVWRFVSHSESLWARSIKAIHGSNIQCPSPLRKRYNSCWKSILHEVNSLSKRGIQVLKYLQIKLGDGKSTKFWYDSWCEEGVLKEKFPRVFALELCKNMNVADKVSQLNPFQTFRRTPRGGIEQDQFQQIDRILQKVNLKPIKDSWVWELDKSGTFSVASVRKCIDDTMIQSYELKTRWNNLVPIKVNIHAWRVSNNSLPTRFNISRRGMLIDSIICPNCDVGVETTGHSFFSCSMVRDINLLIARWWNINIEDFDCYEEWSTWIDSVRLSTKVKKTVEAVFYISWWLLWRYRNSKIFKEKIPKKSSFFDELQSRSFLWYRFRGKKKFGWNDWLNHPECISL